MAVSVLPQPVGLLNFVSVMSKGENSLDVIE